MKALSIRAPWWWWLFLPVKGAKNIENRTRRTHHRGPVLVHASKWWDKDKILNDDGFALDMWAMTSESGDYRGLLGALMRSDAGRILDLQDPTGHIVGIVDIVDCVDNHSGPWFVGPYGYVLANPIALKKPYPVKGALGLFNAPASDEVRSIIAARTITDCQELQLTEGQAMKILDINDRIEVRRLADESRT